MSVIEKIKPSKLNEFDGNWTGAEIIQVTRPSVGTYKATVNQVRDISAPIVLTQEEYDALEVKDEKATYYIYEEE